jgi:hypothetical protein
VQIAYAHLINTVGVSKIRNAQPRQPVHGGAAPFILSENKGKAQDVFIFHLDRGALYF